MRKFLSKVPAWLAGAFLVFATGCSDLLFFLPPAREGKHYIQPTTQDDITRGLTVAACLQQWARSNGYPNADYSDVDFTKLVIVRVGDPGVLGWYNGKSFLTDEREAADTLFINLGVSASQYAGFSRHGDVHVVQEKHRELIGSNGDIHWAPPWDYCRVPRVFFQ